FPDAIVFKLNGGRFRKGIGKSEYLIDDNLVAVGYNKVNGCCRLIVKNIPNANLEFMRPLRQVEKRVFHLSGLEIVEIAGEVWIKPYGFVVLIVEDAHNIVADSASNDIDPCLVENHGKPQGVFICDSSGAEQSIVHVELNFRTFRVNN